jgi:MSHA biogenesis protein MshE
MHSDPALLHAAQPAAFNPQKFRLGEVLIRKGLLTEPQLHDALAHQKKTGRKLGRTLTDLKLVDETTIGQVIAEQLGLPFVDLHAHEFDPALVRRLPEAQARRFRAIVLAEQFGGLQVGLVDPSDMLAYDQLCRALATTVHPVVVTESALLGAVDRIYQRQEELSGLARQVAADIDDGTMSLQALEADLTAEDAPVVRLIQSLFQAAVARDVSDIHVEPQERHLQVRFRVDGAMHVQQTADARIGPALVRRLKLMAQLDISEKRLPQDGRFRVKVAGSTLDVRISTLPMQHGESVVMRLLAQNADRARLDALCMPAPILARLNAVLNHTSGLIVVTGPTGSGKTTTLYAALAALNKPDVKIITVEDPVEYRLPGIVQVQVNDKVDLTFARVLRAGLRQDPDVILVGEMRDQETAEIGLRAALTGHLVLSTLHTNDAASTPMRLRDMGIPGYMIAMGVRLVIAQRLVRAICPHCRTTHQPLAHEHEWLQLELGEAAGTVEVHRGAGCNHCHDTGYRGRLAVYEMIEMTPELVALAAHDDPGAFTARAQSLFAEHTLRRHALQLVRDGRTTVAEAMRIGSQY